MTEPNLDREHFVLERAQKGLAPSAAQRKATLERLGAALALGPSLIPPAPSASGFAPHAPAEGAAKAATTFSVRTLVTGIVSGVVIGFGAGYFVSNHTAARAPEVRPIVLANADIPRAPAIATPPPAPAPIATEPPRAHREAAAATPAGSLHAARREPERRGAAESANYDELSYIQRGLMQTLDQLQPKGALLAERAVVSVLALCRLDRVNDARLVAEAMLKGGNATEVYRRRMESSCVGPMEEKNSQ